MNNPDLKSTKISRRGFIRLAIIAALAGFGGRGYLNTRSIRLESVEIKLSRLPRAFHGLRLGVISDIHAGPLVSSETIGTGVELLMSRHPDLIILAGDYVHGATRFLWTRVGGFKAKHFDACLKELGRLSAPFGVFGVLGNHDHWSGPKVTQNIVEGLEGIGIKILRNDRVILTKSGQEIILAGVDDYWEGPANLSRTFRGARSDLCTILISHNPDINDDVSNIHHPIDLIICGHTHGGQINAPFIGPPVPTPFHRRYLSGLVRDGYRQTYISRGLGVFFVPARLNCPPEVTVMTLLSL